MQAGVQQAAGQLQIPVCQTLPIVVLHCCQQLVQQAPGLTVLQATLSDHMAAQVTALRQLHNQAQKVTQAAHLQQLDVASVLQAAKDICFLHQLPRAAGDDLLMQDHLQSHLPPRHPLVARITTPKLPWSRRDKEFSLGWELALSKKSSRPSIRSSLAILSLNCSL